MSDRFRTGIAAVDWGDIRFFLALARAGSLSGAARSLRVNHATVARRIAALEAALGQSLFERRADGYVPTARGRAALDLAGAMERSAQALADGVAPETAEGTVRLATVRSFADAFLAERLVDLRRAHPGLCLEIVTDARIVSLARREADAALRLGTPAGGELVGRRLADIGYAYYAAPGLAAAAADPGTPAIGYPADEAEAREAAWIENRFADRRFAVRSDSLAAQAAAARAGLGVVMLPRYLGRREAGLTEVDLGPAHPARALWLLWPKELARVPRVRAALDAIGRVVVRDRAALA